MGLLLQIHPVTPQPRLLDQAVQCLQRDGLVVWPTESGYGMGCSAASPKGLAKLYRQTTPVKAKVLALLFNDFSQISQYADVSNFAFRTMKHLMPGPYTFILPARHRTAKMLEVKRPEVGVRMPTHPVMRGILERMEHPLVNAAARFSERETEVFSTGEDVQEQYGKSVDLVLDAQSIAPIGTTIVSLIGDEIRLIRSGIGPLEPLGLEE
ncbi:MAG: threonylcarbamoyl-AMP synthase [Fibrobacteres bacterium]|nr:threonylcarbamoyl-AMP synthase [Fibrobacterota bacterium]